MNLDINSLSFSKVKVSFSFSWFRRRGKTSTYGRDGLNGLSKHTTEMFITLNV